LRDCVHDRLLLGSVRRLCSGVVLDVRHGGVVNRVRVMLGGFHLVGDLVDRRVRRVLVPSRLYLLGLAVVVTRDITLVLLNPLKIVLSGGVSELVWLLVHIYMLAAVMMKHHSNVILPLIIIHHNLPRVTIYLSLLSLMHMLIQVLMLLSVHGSMRLLSPTLRFHLP